jgi:hypothetical protein
VLTIKIPRKKERMRHIDAHGLKIQEYLKFLPKSVGGVKGFRKKLPVGRGGFVHLF